MIVEVQLRTCTLKQVCRCNCTYVCDLARTNTQNAFKHTHTHTHIPLSSGISISRQWDNDNSCLWITYCTQSTWPLCSVNTQPVLFPDSCHYFAKCSTVESMRSLLFVRPQWIRPSMRMKPALLFFKEREQRRPKDENSSACSQKCPHNLKGTGRRQCNANVCSLHWNAALFGFCRFASVPWTLEHERQYCRGAFSDSLLGSQCACFYTN